MATPFPRNLATEDVIDEAWTDAVTASFYNLPWGHLAVAFKTADQTGIQSQVDVSGLAVTNLPVVANRRLRLTAYLPGYFLTSLTYAQFFITDASNTALGMWQNPVVGAAQQSLSVNLQTIYTTTAGQTALTAKLRAQAGAASLTIAASAAVPAFFLVEDIGPVTPQ